MHWWEKQTHDENEEKVYHQEKKFNYKTTLTFSYISSEKSGTSEEIFTLIAAKCRLLSLAMQKIMNCLCAVLESTSCFWLFDNPLSMAEKKYHKNENFIAINWVVKLLMHAKRAKEPDSICRSIKKFSISDSLNSFVGLWPLIFIAPHATLPITGLKRERSKRGKNF